MSQAIVEAYLDTDSELMKSDMGRSMDGGATAGTAVVHGSKVTYFIPLLHRNGKSF